MTSLPSPHPHILVAEDDARFRELLLEGLADFGFEPQAACSGRTALACIRERKPDLLLCDVTMPDGSGHDVLRAIRADRQLADLPVIFLSAFTGGAEVRAGMNLGADDYLTKPIAFTELRRAVEARLARAKVVRGDPSVGLAAGESCPLPEPVPALAGRAEATRACELAYTLGRAERRRTDLLVMMQSGWVRCLPDDFDSVVGALLTHALHHTRPGDAIWLVGAWEANRYQLTLWSRETVAGGREAGLPVSLARPLEDSGLRRMAARLWANGGELQLEDCAADGVRMHLHFQPASLSP